MKAALNASVRDAQVRDSFNKESSMSVESNTLYNLCVMLYTLQKELPRNASKLHCLVVTSGDDQFVLNYEVLRSIKFDISSDVVGFADDDFLTKLVKKHKSQTKLVKVKEDVQNDN